MDPRGAQEIVFAFADLLSKGLPPIPDESTLPWNKAVLKQAFSIFISELEKEKAKNPLAFREKGLEHAIQAAKGCMSQIDDFHKIKSEDQSAVNLINKRSSRDLFDEESIGLLLKYPLGGGS
jgi:hypothetical protein